MAAVPINDSTTRSDAVPTPPLMLARPSRKTSSSSSEKLLFVLGTAELTNILLLVISFVLVVLLLMVGGAVAQLNKGVTQASALMMKADTMLIKVDANLEYVQHFQLLPSNVVAGVGNILAADYKGITEKIAVVGDVIDRFLPERVEDWGLARQMEVFSKVSFGFKFAKTMFAKWAPSNASTSSSNPNSNSIKIMERLVFGGPMFEWLSSQFTEANMHHLGHVCDTVATNIDNIQYEAVGGKIFHYDYNDGYHDSRYYSFYERDPDLLYPLKHDAVTVAHAFTAEMRKICTIFNNFESSKP